MCNETKENKALFTALPKVNLCKRVVLTHAFLTPDIIRIKEVNLSENNIKNNMEITQKIKNKTII